MPPTAVALCLLMCAASAQSAPAEAGRDKLLGETLHADGKPWPGATVRLVFRTLPERDDFGRTDVVELQSDAAGQFKAALLPCCAYLAYACEPLADGRARCSAVVDGVLAATHLALRAEAVLRRPVTIQLAGIEAWAKVQQPVRACAVAASTLCRLALPVALDGQGRGTVPPLPGGVVTLEVFGKDGLPLQDFRLHDDDPAAARSLVLGPPVRVRATVQAGGKEIAGATLWVVATESRRSAPVATTDAAGRCEVWLPGRAAGQPGSLSDERELQVDAQGFTLGATRLAAACPATAWHAADAAREVTLRVEPGCVATGRVLGADGKPLGGLPLLLSCWGIQRESEAKRRTVQVWRPLTTAADGTFRLPCLNQAAPFRVVADAFHPGLAGRTAAPLAPLALLASAQELADRTTTLGDLGPGAVPPVVLEVHAADGAPARNVRLEWCSASMVYTTAELPAAHTDGRGRVALLTPPERLTLRAEDQRGQVRFEAVQPRKDDALRVVTLETPQTIRGTVVDEHGKPVAGATMSLRPLRPQGDGGLTPEQRSLRSQYNQSGLRGSSDAQGRFELRFLPIAGTQWNVSAELKRSDRTVARSQPVTADQDSQGDVQLRLEPVEAAGKAP